VDRLGDLFHPGWEDGIEGHNDPAQHDAYRGQDDEVHIGFLPGVVGVLRWQLFIFHQSQHLQGFDLDPFDVIFPEQQALDPVRHEILARAQQDVEGQDDHPQQADGAWNFVAAHLPQIERAGQN
jgi:hypothetical protein